MKSCICPEGPLKKSVGFYDTREVFRLYEGDEGPGAPCPYGILSPVKEYCAETYPEGYRVLNAVLCDHIWGRSGEFSEKRSFYESFRGKSLEKLSEEGLTAKVADMLFYLKDKLILNEKESGKDWFRGLLLEETEKCLDILAEA